ncbi:PIN domain-containing protein [Nocardia sp. CC227C]|uniref:PIN domain-containing protein n=1 Tax=Nocardia sp. CC227C TaxID=3044562 RepID=UPI00278C5068|nr:PIN domain-containing protein [Nocardia sp. CC227C]
MIDTNIVDADPNLVGAAWTALTAAIAAGEVEVLVPEVVVREVARHIRRDSKGARNEVIKAVKAIQANMIKARLGVAALHKLPSATELRAMPAIGVDEAQSQFRDRLIGLGCEIGRIPTPNHDLLVDWSLIQHHPFDTTDKGYRDALIWWTFYEAARKDTLRFAVLVSNDNDFFQRGSCELHEELGRHLEHGGMSTSVGFARSIPDALAVAQRAIADTSWLPQTELSTARVRELLTEPILDLFGQQVLEAPLVTRTPDGAEVFLAEGYEVPQEVDGATVVEFSYDRATLIQSVREGYEGVVWVGTARAVMDLEYEGFVSKSLLYIFEDDEDSGSLPIWLVDSDVSGDRVRVRGGFSVEAVFRFAIDPYHETVNGLDLERIQARDPD